MRGTSRAGVRAASGLAAFALAVGAGHGSDGLISREHPPELLVLSTGDVIGYIDTCGCKQNPAGGIARRAWVVGQLREALPSVPIAILDSGNFTGNPTAAGEAKTALLLDSMARLGYSVVNVGERELKQGYDAFVRKVEGSGLRFVSANIVDRETREPVFAPSARLEVAAADGSRRMTLGVVGAARFNPVFREAGPGGRPLTIDHPVERVSAEVEALRAGDVDFVVLLAALHHEDARKIAAAVPGIDLVIGSYGGYVAPLDAREGRTPIVYSGNQGQQIAETRVYLDGERRITDQRTQLHHLTQVYPGDQETLDRIAAAEIPSSGGTAVPEHVAEVAMDGPFVGVTACRSCHVAEAEQWDATRHATALHTLESKQKVPALECLVCHTTGAGIPGGFRARESEPELAAVTCESCHGPGKRHLADTSRPYGEIGIGSCTLCHDRENSPGFDYYRDVTKVSHGDRARP